MEIYPAKYTDKNGEVETTIRNDWKILRMNLRGVEFSGRDFDAFEPDGNFSESELSSVTLSRFNDLCDCVISCEIPLKIFDGKEDFETTLEIRLELGSENESGGLDKEDLILNLESENAQITSRGVSGWFEDELIDIEKQLPNNQKLKCCFGCDFSDYSVYGHGLFGSMLCFKNIKDEYRKVFSKDEYMEIMDKSIEQVQETYLCSEFEIRKTGRGYRG